MRRPRAFARYTEEARRAIFFARIEAGYAQASMISSSHLLLGLTWDKHLASCPISAVQARESDIRKVLCVADRDIVNKGPFDKNKNIPLDDHAKRALAWTTHEADRDNQFWIDSNHLLRGILLSPGDAAGALVALSLDLDEVRKQAARHRKIYPPKSVLWSYYIKKAAYRIYRVLVILACVFCAALLSLALLDVSRIVVEMIHSH
jgi:hypothetical protein